MHLAQYLPLSTRPWLCATTPKTLCSAGVKIDRVGKEVVIVGGEPGICNLQHYDGIFPKLKTITRDSNGWDDGGKYQGWIGAALLRCPIAPAWPCLIVLHRLQFE